MIISNTRPKQDVKLFKSNYTPNSLCSYVEQDVNVIRFY
jgi:hypothetical protein